MATRQQQNDFFRIKSSSIFAYQEIDRFSSFCDEDEQINDEEKNFQSDGTNNKDEYNNCSTAFSMEINEESQNSANCIKRKSMIDVPNFSQYIHFHNEVLEGGPNYENSEGGNEKNFDEFVNNYLNADNMFLNLDNTNKEKYINEFIIILKDNENFNSKISKTSNFNEIEDYVF